MGIVNVTPDSFADAIHRDVTGAIEYGIDLSTQGADIIDVGGESTRPGADRVSEPDELVRVIPVVGALASLDIPVSVDTVRSAVAQAAVRAGAIIVNDVSGGLADPAMFDVVAESGAGYVLQHWRVPFDHRISGWDIGDGSFCLTSVSGWDKSDGSVCRTSGQDHQNRPHGLPHPLPPEGLPPIVSQVQTELAERVTAALRAGVGPGQLILDPGLGFGKTAAQNWELVAHADIIAGLGFPVLWGTSRKRFLAEAYDHPTEPWQRDDAGTALTALLARQGVWAVRTHTVAAHRTAIAVASRTRG